MLTNLEYYSAGFASGILVCFVILVVALVAIRSCNVLLLQVRRIELVSTPTANPAETVSSPLAASSESGSIPRESIPTSTSTANPTRKEDFSGLDLRNDRAWPSTVIGKLKFRGVVNTRLS